MRGPVETPLRIAGHDVLIRYVDPGLAETLGRATCHLKGADGGIPDLIIDCWIDPDIAGRMPAEWPASGTSFSDDGLTVFTWEGPEGPLFAYDRNRRHGWAVFRSVAAIPAWEQAAPFRQILHWWAAGDGMQLLHAAAVGTALGGILLVGRSGSGKSTTSLACLDAGLGFAGDDYCVLSDTSQPRIDSLYLSAKADPEVAALLPGLRDAFAKSPLRSLGKAVLFADRIRPESVCTGFPLRGIVVPRISDAAESHLTRLGPAAALRAMAPSTVLQMPGGRTSDLAGMAAMARSVSAWELTLGCPESAVVLIKKLLGGEGP